MVKKLPHFIAIIVMIVMVWVNFNNTIWKGHNRVIAWDILSYYAYLPASVIENDLTLQFYKDSPEAYKAKYWPGVDGNGNLVIKTTMGLAYFYAPGFFIAHALAEPLGYKADGFSIPYVFALVMSMVFYMGIGIFFLAKFLLRYFPPIPVIITILCVFFGTNLLYYSCFEPAMSHAYNFVLFSIFLYLTPTWLQNPSFGRTLGFGLLAGLIVLARPTNILIGLVPLLWGVTSFALLKERLLWLAQKWPIVLLAIAAAISVWLPQLSYWKYITGSWWYYSYTSERFYWLDSRIIDGLFSYRKGWLVYTPIMFVALAGIPILIKKYRQFALPVTIFTALNIYVVFAWWSWWYGGSFGMRALIDSYALLSIPFAATITWLVSKGAKAIIPMAIVLFLLCAYNWLQTYQKLHHTLHHDCMTKEAYWATFLKLEPNDKYRESLNCPWQDDDKRLHPEKYQ